MTSEMKLLLDMLCYNCDEPEHVERAVDILVEAMVSVNHGQTLPDRLEMVRYVTDQW